MTDLDSTQSRGGRRLGLRREVLILLPVSLLLLVVLSAFTLFSYRNALRLLVEERQEEAARAARFVADQLAGGRRGTGASDLRLLAPGARGVAVVDADGRPRWASGELPAEDLLGPAQGRLTEGPFGVGPDAVTLDAVVGFAPLAGPPARSFVRVDLEAGVLARQQRSLRVLTLVVLAVDAALMLLVLFFLGHLMAPFETLLARAREVEGLDRAAGRGGRGEGRGGDSADEVEFLLATFDRAIENLAGRDGRRAEDDIAALERTLSASLQSGLLLLDRAGAVLALNTVGAELLATPAPEPGTPLPEVLAGQPELLEVLAAAVAEGRAPQRQECTVRAAGGPLTVGLTVHPLRRDGGSVRGYLVLFADLTEVLRKAEESRLAESLARLGEMAGGVAHELRNSLATLRGYLTLIERRPDEESVAGFLSEIRHEATHLERVLDDFLAFARPGTARLHEVDLGRLLERAAADPALGGFPVRVLPPAAGALLRADALLLERAVRNLLHNAVQAEREAGREGPVEAGLRRGAGGWEVTIEDRGPGFPAEVRERLFHPFATGRRGGVGLGLALAHRIVTLHGGRIRIEDRPGGGTRVVLVFPGDTSVTEGNREAPAGDSAGNPPRSS